MGATTLVFEDDVIGYVIVRVPISLWFSGYWWWELRHGLQWGDACKMRWTRRRANRLTERRRELIPQVRRSFLIAAPVVWNSLPLHLHSPSISRSTAQDSFFLGCSLSLTFPLRTIEEIALNWTELSKDRLMSEEYTVGRARVTTSTDEERVLYVVCDWQVVVTSRELCLFMSPRDWLWSHDGDLVPWINSRCSSSTDSSDQRVWPAAGRPAWQGCHHWRPVPTTDGKIHYSYSIDN